MRSQDDEALVPNWLSTIRSRDSRDYLILTWCIFSVHGHEGFHGTILKLHPQQMQQAWWMPQEYIESTCTQNNTVSPRAMRWRVRYCDAVPQHWHFLWLNRDWYKCTNTYNLILRFHNCSWLAFKFQVNQKSGNWVWKNWDWPKKWMCVNHEGTNKGAEYW